MKDWKELGINRNSIATPSIYLLYLKGIITEEEIIKFNKNETLDMHGLWGVLDSIDEMVRS